MVIGKVRLIHAIYYYGVGTNADVASLIDVRGTAITAQNVWRRCRLRLYRSSSNEGMDC